MRHEIENATVLIDEEDYARVSCHKWKVTLKNNHYYARGWIARKPYYLHRFIMNSSPGQRVEFLNGNSLDCRKKNLRHMNGTKLSTLKRELKGITKFSYWQGKIVKHGKIYVTKHYKTREETVVAYNRLVKRLRGKYGAKIK